MSHTTTTQLKYCVLIDSVNRSIKVKIIVPVRRKTSDNIAGYGVAPVLNLPGSLGVIVNLRALFDAEIPKDFTNNIPNTDIVTIVAYSLKTSFLIPTAPVKVLDATVGKSIFGKVLTRWEGRVIDEEFISYSSQHFKQRRICAVNYNWDEFSCDEPPTSTPPTITGDFIAVSSTGATFSLRVSEKHETIGDSFNISLVVPCAGFISITYAYQNLIISRGQQPTSLPIVAIGL